ncbi:hypothetical protein GCM10007862_08820 [Dyella lipolytica]|uniref:Phage baseplate protein n=1 Tax=Dyella lipolytica TaxID=1867835 RepID=A0ABW8IXZ3_9GAMM|nr:hypothetical protein [Dyella lipolytica]GLQ45831.1 hypothetical protein GCM10007862_08820 [Dyella lipolytica]
MQALSGERLLAACEQAQGEHALLQAITLLAAVLPECDRAELLRLPITERNRLLLQLRQLSFGPVLEGYADCTRCGAAMEFSLSVADALAGMDEIQAPTSVDWTDQDIPLHLRQATTVDLLASIDAPTTEQAEARLLTRCLGLDELVDDVAQRITMPSARAQFEQIHAAGELHCTLRCPHCMEEETWELDVSHYVWQEARHAAHRLLTDIHTLALHYGWSESDIARMSQPRRNAYLELLSA